MLFHISGCDPPIRNFCSYNGPWWFPSCQFQPGQRGLHQRTCLAPGKANQLAAGNELGPWYEKQDAWSLFGCFWKRKDFLKSKDWGTSNQLICLDVCCLCLSPVPLISRRFRPVTVSRSSDPSRRWSPSVPCSPGTRRSTQNPHPQSQEAKVTQEIQRHLRTGNWF